MREPSSFSCISASAQCCVPVPCTQPGCFLIMHVLPLDPARSVALVQVGNAVAGEQLGRRWWLGSAELVATGKDPPEAHARVAVRVT